jgi:hypothetical protein
MKKKKKQTISLREYKTDILPMAQRAIWNAGNLEAGVRVSFSIEQNEILRPVVG